MIERIPLHVAAHIIGYSDNRGFRKWCINNGVGILADYGSNKFYVIKEEFESAKMKIPIKYLTEKYGNENLQAIVNMIQQNQLVSSDARQLLSFPCSHTQQNKNQSRLDSDNTRAMLAPMEPLHLPESMRIRGLGLTVFCNYKQCRTNVKDTCFANGKNLKSCPNGHNHVYKAYVVEKATGHRRTRVFLTRDPREALRLALMFAEEVNGRGQVEKVNPEKVVTHSNSDSSRFLVSSTISQYINLINDVGVGKNFKKHNLSEEHRKDIERSFKHIEEFLETHGGDYSSFTTEKITDKFVDEFCDYLTDEKEYSGRTFNKIIGYYKSMMGWHFKEQNVSMVNWFDRVDLKTVEHNPTAISSKEFENLLHALTAKNGKKEDKVTGDRRYLHRNYLSLAFRLALHTGFRREELTQLKFSDVFTEDGINYFIRTPDFKVNRIKGNKFGTNIKYKYLPVTRALKEILTELDFEKYVGTNKYLIAPELERNRTRIMCDDLSRAFSHYISIKGVSDRKLTFKSMRKAFATAAHLHTAGNAKLLTQHSDNSVIEKNYLDLMVVANAGRDFEVFPQDAERNNELKIIRGESEVKSKNHSLEK